MELRPLLLIPLVLGLASMWFIGSTCYKDEHWGVLGVFCFGSTFVITALCVYLAFTVR